MTKQCVRWKPVICRDIRGEDFVSDLPDAIASIYCGTLISEIVQMPRKNPISFERAIDLLSEKLNIALREYNAKDFSWYCNSFVSYLSDAGFHIELSGDEFEIAGTATQVS